MIEKSPCKKSLQTQICTTREQSERLLSLGLKRETADMSYTAIVVNHKADYRLDCSTPKSIDIPAWSLGRLIEMLPSPIYPKEELPSFSGCAYLNLAQIAVWYDYTDYDMDDRTLISWSGNGFFSAVVNCIEWLIQKGYFPKEYLEE